MARRAGVPQGGTPTGRPDAPGPLAPTAADLTENGKRQRRWLSNKASRIVLNPFAFTSTRTPLEHAAGPSVPLHVGYYVGSQALDRTGLLGLYRREPGAAGTEPDRVGVLWADEFTALEPGWRAGDGVRAESVAGDRLRLTLARGGADYWGEWRRRLTIAARRTPYLSIGVAAAADAWGLRMRVPPGAGGHEIVVAADTTRTGEHTFALEPLLGPDPVEVEIVLRVATWEQPAEFTHLRLLAVDPVLLGTDSVDYSWAPHELGFAADYAGARIAGTDRFADLDTVLRSVRVTGVDAHWTLAGMVRGRPRWEPRRRTLSIEERGHCCAIALGDAAEPAGTVRYAVSLPGLLVDDTRTRPSHAADPFYWSLPVRLLRDGRERTLAAVSFATAGEGGAAAAGRRARAAAGRAPSTVARAHRRKWDGFLRRVPNPLAFDLYGVPRLGVSAADVRHTYYAAWAFLAANILPPLPETGFGYPQHATGKPSLYADGPPQAASIASWESLFAIQLWAYVDPAAAWAAYAGLMSLVAEDGALAGEALPTRKAQTAAVLSGLARDDDALAAVYPALRRHLSWAADNPRWILRGLTPPDQKDAQFVASAIIDLGYARDLAALLGYADDVRRWERLRAELLANYLDWFWPKPDSPPNLFYLAESGKRDPGNILWIAPGLHIDLLPRGCPQLESMQERFDETFDPARFFAGFAQPKYPDLSYAAAGLLDLGRTKDARMLLNAALRDVCRSHQFAEEYHLVADGSAGRPRADGSGVRPSVFGAAMVIDAVWQNNGLRFDLGPPALVRLGNNAAAVRGLRINGRQLDLHRAANSATTSVRGGYVGGGPHAVRLAPGETRLLAGGRPPGQA